MTYDERIQEDKQKIVETKQAIKVLQEKKAIITDAAELKAINKQINALQDETGNLKADIRYCARMNRDLIRDYHEMILDDFDDFD